MLPGVYTAYKKDGTLYYRASITYQGKHISLGSFPKEDLAARAYCDAKKVIASPNFTITEYTNSYTLSFSKWVTLINFRDNGIYIKTPIYLKHRYFEYYFEPDLFFLFDVDDLFYYSTHTIMRRGGHLFVSDYGLQQNILTRYGIKNYGVPGRDYRFINGNAKDFRYENIEIINHYYGVFLKSKNGKFFYETRVHLNGNYIVGRYATEVEAAVAYNKAVTILIKKGYSKEYPVNYIEEINEQQYKELFKTVSIRLAITKIPENIE